jgi:hypothetical protein
MKKLLLYSICALAVCGGLFAANGYSHNNSAPNFECVGCHQGDMAADLVKVDGLPKKYVPGKTYKLTITVNSTMKSEGDVAGGFAAEASGGTLVVVDKKNTQLSDGLLTHTQEGSVLRKWTIGWKAPSRKEEVTLSIMAMAANGDFSPNGDVVGAEIVTLKP